MGIPIRQFLLDNKKDLKHFRKILQFTQDSYNRINNYYMNTPEPRRLFDGHTCEVYLAILQERIITLLQIIKLLEKRILYIIA